MTTEKANFQSFLDRMRNAEATDLVRTIRSFILTFSDENHAEESGSKVQNFLSETENLIVNHPLWKSASREEVEGVGEALEKYVMLKIYQYTFAIKAEEKKQDEEIQNKICALQLFVRPSNLDVPGSFQEDDTFQQAVQEIQKLTSFKAPKDKLVCIMNCCKLLNTVLVNSARKAQDGTVPGADEFLPLLIFALIKANPPQLISNLNYIQRYRHPSRLVSESAYFFTILFSASAFLQNLTAASLSMAEGEFSRQMREAYTKLGFPVPSQFQGKATEQGASQVGSQARIEAIVREFRFAFSELEDLRVGDVKLLLREYKEIVVRYAELLERVERLEAGGETGNSGGEGELTSVKAGNDEVKLPETSPGTDDFLGLLGEKEPPENEAQALNVDILEGLKELEESLQKGESLSSK